MTEYIMSILRSRPLIVMSWGFHSARGTSNGIKFQVNGFKFRGTVEISYCEALDLFEVKTIDQHGQIKHQEEQIYADQLVEVIDSLVERCQDYEERVKFKYHIIEK